MHQQYNKSEIKNMKKTQERLTFKQNKIKQMNKDIVKYAHSTMSYKEAIEFIKIARRKCE